MEHGKCSLRTFRNGGIHGRAEDSRHKLLDSNVVITLVARIGFGSKGVRRSIANAITVLAKYGKSSD